MMTWDMIIVSVFGVILVGGTLLGVFAGGSRVQLDFSKEAYAMLQSLKKASDSKTNAEVVRNALRLYQWFLEKKAAGQEIQLVDGDDVRPVELKF
jgi:preprotein translocase subunit SecF